MTTPAELQTQLNALQQELSELRTESTINVGLLATAIRRSRLALAALEQEAAVRLTQGNTSLIGWDPREGAFSKGIPATPLAQRINAGGGAGGAAVQQTTLLLQEPLKAFDAVLLTAIQLAMLEMGPGTATYDTRLLRAAAKTFQIDDTAGGPANVWLAGDLVELLGASYAITYNGDGTVATVTRSGAQGAATTTITYVSGKVTSIVTVRGGKTTTVTPTYTGSQITALARAVA